MNPNPCSFGSHRRVLLGALASLAILFATNLPACSEAPSTTETLPSWNEGPAKQAIVDFVKATTDTSSPDFVPPEERIATFDQDGTSFLLFFPTLGCRRFHYESSLDRSLPSFQHDRKARKP